MHCKACDKSIDEKTHSWNAKLKSLENLCADCLEEVQEMLRPYLKEIGLDKKTEEEYNYE